MQWSSGICGLPVTGRRSSRHSVPTTLETTRRQNSGAPSFAVWKPISQAPGWRPRMRRAASQPKALSADGPNDEEVAHHSSLATQSRDERETAGSLATGDQVAACVAGFPKYVGRRTPCYMPSSFGSVHLKPDMSWEYSCQSRSLTGRSPSVITRSATPPSTHRAYRCTRTAGEPPCPSAGREVTGRVGITSLTFVTRVIAA